MVLVVADPPYYLTSGYKGETVGLDIYRQVGDLIQRLRQNNNNILYTDEAWWHKKAPDANLQLPGVETETDGMVLAKIKANLSHFGEVSGIGKTGNQHGRAHDGILLEVLPTRRGPSGRCGRRGR